MSSLPPQPESADDEPAITSQMQQMLRTMPQVGQVVWIGLRTAKRGPIQSVDSADISLEQGLVGDHFSGPPGAKRQVTLIQHEHLEAMASMLGLPNLEPATLRRNIVVRGLNLLALKNCRFQIGQAVLEATGPCAPCSMIEEALGPGAYNISRGHAGITARVVREGAVRVGSEVRWLSLTTR
jgi:MOSC domain-containing protein YiiM